MEELPFLTDVVKDMTRATRRLTPNITVELNKVPTHKVRGANHEWISGPDRWFTVIVDTGNISWRYHGTSLRQAWNQANPCLDSREEN